MANCIATCYGVDTTRTKTDHRLGHVAAGADVATWHTHIVSEIRADGSGYISIIRDGKQIAYIRISAEGNHNNNNPIVEVVKCE